MNGLDVLAALLLVVGVLALGRVVLLTRRRRDRARWITDDAWAALQRRARESR